MLTEAKAGRSQFDVFVGPAEFVYLLKKNKLAEAYLSPERAELEDDLKDREGYWSAVNVNTYVLVYNTRLVAQPDVPRIYAELLNNRWFGRKIFIDDESSLWIFGLMEAWGEKKTSEFLKDFLSQRPLVQRGNVLGAQLVAAGEVPLGFTFAHVVERLKRTGAPLDWVPLEPVVAYPNVVMLSGQAGNQLAGKLFIDFLLSRDGQTTVRDFNRISARKDVKPRPARLLGGFKRIVVVPRDEKSYQAAMLLNQNLRR